MALIYLLIVLLNKQTKNQYRLVSIDDLLEAALFSFLLTKVIGTSVAHLQELNQFFNRMIQRF